MAKKVQGRIINSLRDNILLPLFIHFFVLIKPILVIIKIAIKNYFKKNILMMAIFI